MLARDACAPSTATSTVAALSLSASSRPDWSLLLGVAQDALAMCQVEEGRKEEARRKVRWGGGEGGEGGEGGGGEGRGGEGGEGGMGEKRMREKEEGLYG